MTLSVSWSAFGQETDTLSASKLLSVKSRPVIKPTEGVVVPQLPSAPTQVAGILSRFTGVQVKDYGGVGGLKTVNVRSLGSEHVGIFLDGIQIENAQNMQVDLGRFSTDMLGLVTLYNGQKTSRLQTAREYAAGAAVYLDTDNYHFFPDGGRVRLKGGSFATVNPSVTWKKELAPFLYLRVNGEFLTSNGKYKYPCFDTTLVRENGDILFLRLEAQLSRWYHRGNWNIHVYTYGSERGFPGPVIRRAQGFPFSAERQADQDLFVQGRWTQDWTDRYATSVRFKYANSYTHYNTHPEKNPMALPYDLHYRQQSAYLSLAQSLILAFPWTVDFATDLQYAGLNSDMGQFVTPRRLTFTGALASKLAWDRFRTAASLVYTGAWDWFKTPSAGGWSGEDSYRDTWMPSLTLYYAPWPWLEVSAFAKRTYRLPSFNDLYYSLMGNARLQPEAAAQFGADVIYSGRAKAWSWALRLSPYYNHVSDKIVAIPTSSQFRWTMLNIGKVDVTGLDVKAEVGYEGTSLGVNTVLRYTYQRALDHSTPGSQTWGNQIPYIPLHSGSIGLTFRWEQWYLNWDTVLTGSRWSRSANTADYYVAPWSTSDVSLTRKFRKYTAGIACKNIFNRSYEIVQGYPMPGFNWMLSVEYNW
ncbi:MAG: TonB-dependent receptor [Bacteroidales bacterium]|nr:TonB-dependent receptor [Bacteroidales bacterium]